VKDEEDDEESIISDEDLYAWIAGTVSCHLATKGDCRGNEPTGPFWPGDI
jgi:hypothetical protein